MGFLNRNTTVTVKVPKVTFVRDYRGRLDWNLVAGIAFSTLAFVVIAAFALGITYKALLYIDRKPPKVITKTVYESALQASQRAYIQQCEQNTVDNGGQVEQGIPNTINNPWTCTYAK